MASVEEMQARVTHSRIIHTEEDTPRSPAFAAALRRKQVVAEDWAREDRAAFEKRNTGTAEPEAATAATAAWTQAADLLWEMLLFKVGEKGVSG